MINVIGVSYSSELFLKALYENSVGRLTESFLENKAPSPEMKVEGYIQKIAIDYTDFVKLRPWYEYPFYSKLKEFWKIKDGPNTSLIRRIERRIFFSVELLIKAVYGKLIGLGTESVYEPETLELKAWIKENGKSKILSIPRYQTFTQTVPKLVSKNISFVEIAGNRQILLTLIAPKETNFWETETVLYEWEILTEPNFKRVALIANIQELHKILMNVNTNESKLDHIFDY